MVEKEEREEGEHAMTKMLSQRFYCKRHAIRSQQIRVEEWKRIRNVACKVDLVFG